MIAGSATPLHAAASCAAGQSGYAPGGMTALGDAGSASAALAWRTARSLTFSAATPAESKCGCASGWHWRRSRRHADRSCASLDVASTSSAPSRRSSWMAASCAAVRRGGRACAVVPGTTRLRVVAGAPACAAPDDAGAVGAVGRTPASETYARAAAAAATGSAGSEASHTGARMAPARSAVGREEAPSYAVSLPASTSMNGREALMEDHSAWTAAA